MKLSRVFYPEEILQRAMLLANGSRKIIADQLKVDYGCRDKPLLQCRNPSDELLIELATELKQVEQKLGRIRVTSF